MPTNTSDREVLGFDPVRDVEDFHRKFGISYAGKPRSLGFELSQFRSKFMREEITEYERDSDSLDFELTIQDYSPNQVMDQMSRTLDALVDLVYVALGTAHLHGFDFRAAWVKVHAANMAKEIDGEATSAESRMKLKLKKPPDWQPPDHSDLVRDHAHRAKP